MVLRISAKQMTALAGVATGRLAAGAPAAASERAAPSAAPAAEPATATPLAGPLAPGQLICPCPLGRRHYPFSL